MTFPPIPVSEHEDDAFNELGAGSEHGTRNSADAPAGRSRTRDAAPSRPQTLTPPTDGQPRLTELSPPNTSPRDVSSLASRGEPSTTSPAGAQARRGSTREGSNPVPFTSLQMSPVAFTLGVWALYALMALTAWRAVK